ncbi:MAG: NADH-quinone oxidoreductase subunit K [Coxiellaceae bacterium]|nr:NADH-quinone oxidoreductase subunit K [Coxiellaceae bacterium]
MNDMICWLIGCLVSISIYLMLSIQIMRWLFGIVILSSTINLVIFVSGRLYSSNPAFISMHHSNLILTNPVSQALVLTSIVIGFGLLTFALVLVRKVWRTFDTTNTNMISCAEITHIKSVEDAL